MGFHGAAGKSGAKLKNGGLKLIFLPPIIDFKILKLISVLLLSNDTFAGPPRNNPVIVCGLVYHCCLHC
jgi:hypothetical protein